MIMSFRLKEGKYNILWPLVILKYCLPLMCFTFFGQSFLLLISAFKCLSGKLYYGSKAICPINGLFYFNVILSSLAIIIQIFLSYITISMHFIPDFITEGDNLLKKRTSLPDIIFFFCKIIIILTFNFDKSKEYEHWGIIFIICLITGMNVYYTLFIQNYENVIIKKFHYFYSLFLFYGFFSLLIGKIFRSWNFDGAFYLFLLGFILIVIYCLFYAKTYLEFLRINFNEINQSYDFINYIKSYLHCVKEKEVSRDSSMILTSFIEKIEEKCTNKVCVLKKYISSLSRGFDSNFLLLQFCQKLFRHALNRFPRDINLRIFYIIFLLTKINQKKNAQKELASIKTNFMFLGDSFNLFRCKKYFEEYNSLNNSEFIGFESNDIFQQMEYKNNLNEFRKLLTKSSSLYYDFWSSLYSSHLQGTEDFKKLNDIGAELNEIIEKIEKIFEKLMEIKNNDLATIKLYESYSKNLLNNKEKYEKYYNISMNLMADNTIENRQKDYTNFDLKILNENDEFKFLIISANEENKGTIINISLNGCQLIGYHKHEIIGKNMNILIPEMYHKIHKNLFNEKTEKFKTEFFEKLSNKNIYTPEYLEFTAFGRNKSKYLIPFEFKIFFVQTEDSDLAYVVDFSEKKNYYNDLNINPIDKNEIACVLTDNNLIIQTFTANCVELLELNSNIINSNYEITSFIKQFNDELQYMIASNNREFSGIESNRMNENSINNNSNNTNEKKSENKLMLKKKLLKLNFSQPRKITWKFGKFNKSSKKNLDIEKYQISSLFSPNYNNKDFYDKKEDKNKNTANYIMKVKEAYISKTHIGYYFYFNKIKNINGLKLNSIEDNKKEYSVTPKNKSNLKSQSIKFLKVEEEPKSSRIYINEEQNSMIHKVSFSGLNNEYTKRKSLVNFDLDNINIDRKNESAKLLSDIYDENDIVNCKYIPQCKFNFILDIETMSYKPSTQNNSSEMLYDYLRKESMEKLNIFQHYHNKEKNSNSSYISNTDNSLVSYNSSEVTSSSYDSSTHSEPSNQKLSKIVDKNNNKMRTEKRKGSVFGQNLFQHKNLNINGNIPKLSNNFKNLCDKFEDEYYKVNISKIKFMIYDFSREMVINSNKYEKKSQVEIDIENYKSKQNINISEDSSFSNISFEKYKKEPNNKSNKKKEKTLNVENPGTKNIFDKQKEFEKEISYALNQQDEQESINNFYKVSFFLMIILLLMGIFGIFFFINLYSTLKENLKLIIYAANLKYFTNYGIYYTKENILCNMNSNITDGNFIIPHYDDTNYIEKISESAKTFFIDCHNILEYIISTNFEFCENTKYILNEKPFDIEVIYTNGKLRNITSTFYVSLIQIFSSFCNLLVYFNQITIENVNLYNFVHNIFNNIGNGLNTQIELFTNEFILRQKNVIINTFIISFVFLILHIILYLIISSSYCSIVHKKSSYIAVFYGIGLSLIKSSIKKCEIFINKINQSDENNKMKDFEDDETSSILFSSNNNFNNLFYESNFERKSININNNKKAKNPKKKREIGNDKKSLRFRTISKLGLILSYLYFITIFGTFFILIYDFINASTYLFHMENYHNNVLELFNGFREYLFDQNTIISGQTVYEYLINKEKEFYTSSAEDIKNLTVLNSHIKGLYANYIKLQENGFCSFYVSYFKTSEECENYLGGKDGILSLGFHLIVNTFVEEIRNSRNYMKLLLEQDMVVGNLSKNIDNYSSDVIFELEKNDTKIFRMKVFNMKQTHYRLNIIFLNIIMKYIDEERNITMEAIQDSINNGHIKYIISIIAYLFIFLVIFIFYWIPMIKRMNVEVYKTKNMLSIIPVQILASQPNIKELLNISNNNN